MAHSGKFPARFRAYNSAFPTLVLLPLTGNGKPRAPRGSRWRPWAWCRGRAVLGSRRSSANWRPGPRPRVKAEPGALHLIRKRIYGESLPAVSRLEVWPMGHDHAGLARNPGPSARSLTRSSKDREMAAPRTAPRRTHASRSHLNQLLHNHFRGLEHDACGVADAFGSRNPGPGTQSRSRYRRPLLSMRRSQDDH